MTVESAKAPFGSDAPTFSGDRPTGSAPAKAGVPLPLPVVPGYEIFEELGRGGMGVVYRARHLGLNRLVALKMILFGAHADEGLLARFWAETQTVAKLQHPGIVQVYDSGVHNGLPYCALELLPGGNLAYWLHGQPLPPRDAALLVRKLAHTMHAAHMAGVVHRDLKPSNVLFTADGSPKVTDFGVAKDMRNPSGYTRTGDVVGTPDYMAPEQAGGASKDVGPAADIYALGVILYELLTGYVPFAGVNSLDLLLQVQSAEPVPPRRRVPTVPVDLEVICLKCLEKAPGRRYTSAAALADDLQCFLDDRPILARPVGQIEKLRRWRRRNPHLAASLAGVIAIFLTAFAVVSWSYWRAENAFENEAKQRQEAQAREKAERWERYRANILAGASALRLYNVAAAEQALTVAPEEHRQWEWQYFRHQLDAAQHVLPWPDVVVARVLITPDGARVALFSIDAQVRVWDVAGRKEIRTFRNAKELTAAMFSPDGKLFAYIGPDNTVFVRDIATDRVQALPHGQDGRVHSIRFGTSAARLISTSLDGTLRVWDTETGRALVVVHGRPTPIDAVSPDGHRAAIFDWPAANVNVVNLDTGALVAACHGHEHQPMTAGFNRQGDRMLSIEIYPGSVARLWDPTTGQRVAVLGKLSNSVTSHAFSPDGRRIAVSSRDQTASLWDGVTGAPVAVLKGHIGWVNTVGFSPDSKRLATTSQDHTVRVWDATTGDLLAVLQGHTADVFAATYTADGAYIVSGSRDGTVRLWDARKAERNGILRGHTNFVYGVAFHPDGQHVASAAWDGTVRLWDANTAEQTAVLKYDEKTIVTAVAFHPGGRLLASMGRENAVRLWDSTTGKEVYRWSVPTDVWRDSRLAFSPSGDLLAAGSAGRSVRLWDVNTKAELAVLRGHRDVVRDVAFSPDGRWLASSGDDEDNEIRIWDVAAKTQVHLLQGHIFAVYALAWSRDGKLLASGSTDSTVRLWDTATWQAIAVLKQGARVYGVAFSPDGKRLACACADNTIRFWDVATHQQVAELRGHGDYVHALAFSPDGTRLVSASGDFTVRVWDTLSALERARRQEAKDGH